MATRTWRSDKAACVQLLLNKLWLFPLKRELVGVCVFFIIDCSRLAVVMIRSKRLVSDISMQRHKKGCCAP